MFFPTGCLELSGPKVFGYSLRYSDRGSSKQKAAFQVIEGGFFDNFVDLYAFVAFFCQMAAYSIFKLAFGPPRFTTSALAVPFEPFQESSFSGL